MKIKLLNESIELRFFLGFGRKRSFGLPIAPLTIPSWIPLLLVRSRPTIRRHVTIRYATVPWNMARLNQTDVLVR